MLVYPLYNTLFITYIAALALSLAISLLLIGFVWQRRNIRSSYPLLGIFISIVFWTCGYLIEFLSTNLETKLMSWNISYIGITAISSMLLFFVLSYTGYRKWLTPRNCMLVLLIPAITLILQWTKAYHSLMYYDYHLIVDSPFLLAGKKYGLWFWVYIVYNYLLLTVCLYMLISRFFRIPKLMTEQAVYLVIGILAPFIANINYIFPFLPVAHADWTPAAFTITGIALTLAITKHRFLDILPVARESAIELMHEGFLVIDGQQRIVDLNPAMLEILGRPASEMLGEKLPERINRQLAQNHNLYGFKEFITEIALDLKENLRYFSVHASPLYKSYEHRGGFVLVFHDVTERKLMEEAVKQIAYYDPLTGLPNRSLFNDRTEIAFEEARRFNRKLGILIIDLDKFKDINDSFGHDAGDHVLQNIAIRISNAVRKIDTVSRFGGDEFIVLLPEISDEETAETVAHRITETTARSFISGGHDFNVTISTGIAIYPDDAENINDLIKLADTAMYHVKQNGRNGYTHYRPDMKDSSLSQQ